MRITTTTLSILLTTLLLLGPRPAPIIQAQDQDPCESYCLTTTPPCPPRFCMYPAHLRPACEAAACAAYQAAVLECDIQACAACTSEGDAHAAALKRITQEYDADVQACMQLPPQQQQHCLALADHTKTRATNAESDRHATELLVISSDHAECTETARFIYGMTNCCIIDE